ncbi:DUF974-domain-containing protein [Imleria badia]|nr:DUF974-domain-containing protein [Imleria badia]
MASADGQGHLLSLKVMRVSRPGLAAAWEPFYSSSPSFSAHSTASVLSLQGTTPLPGHPKTLRDLTHVSEFLTLPAAFGTIQLGETFSCCFSVNNETHAAVDGVHVRLEMQTASAKALLCELGGGARTLVAGDGIEDVVHHEVKELGQHVLACTVTYRLPPGFPYAPGPVEGADDPSLQSFRKFYKFSVTNPLSVKTKVHAPKSPSALLHPLERDKVFLEVHIQNMTQETMWFDRMKFECAEGWLAVDANHLSGPDPSDSDDSAQIPQPLFSGSMALMQPQAVRQYIYILSPTDEQTFPVTHPPGSVIALGRLDISWRSKFGEPGRLLTSTLSRRIPGPQQPPLPLPSQPPSAIPPYLQRAPQGPPSSPSRPRSPQLPASRPSSPPPGSFRSNSPFRPRPQPGTPIPASRPLSPAPSLSASGTQLQPLIIPEPASDLDVDLVVVRRAGDVVRVGKPFTLGLKLSVAATIPRGRRRQVRFVVQHLMPRRVSAHAQNVSETPAASSPTLSRFSSALTTPTQAPVNITSEPALGSSPQRLVAAGGDPLLSLPPPYFEIPDDTRNAKLRGCAFLGPSAIPLDPIHLVQQDMLASDPPRVEASQPFELTFLPRRTGFVCVGGLRLVLIGDHLSDADIEPGTNANTSVKEPRTVKELDIIAEIWIQP